MCKKLSRAEPGHDARDGRDFAQTRQPGRQTMAVILQRNLGMLLLAIFLVLYGIAGMVALGLPAPILAVLALIAGILILIGR
jgi:1,4-dihydroxy-2-naphthoate octaprenyltransferase